MIDQSHNIEGKIDAMLHWVTTLSTAYAKALCSSTRRRWRPRRPEGDVLGAHRLCCRGLRD